MSQAPPQAHPPRMPARSVAVPPRVEPAGIGRPWRRSLFIGSLISLLAVVPLLVAFGIDAVEQNRGGDTQVSTAVSDPALPGYEALVTPTGTALVVQVGSAGEPVAVTLVASGGEAGGGGVLLIPIELLVDTDGPRPRTLAEVYQADGADGVALALGRLLRIGFDDVAAVDEHRWGTLVGPVAPLQLDNPDELVDDEGAVYLRAGTVELEAEEVGSYLAHLNPDEQALGRLFRHQLFWGAWLDAIARSPAPRAAVPGEADSGLGVLLRQLAPASPRIVSLPVESLEALADDEETVYVARTEEVPELVAELVPFPSASAPGDRVGVRLLDGTGEPTTALAAVSDLVPAGAQIVIFGNADHFGYDTTEVRYHTADARGDAERLADALGTDRVTSEPREQEPVEVTIVVGGEPGATAR